MSIQFPNSPSTGSTFDASNGLTYRWDGEKWITQGSYQASVDPDAEYVNVSGDTMTGDLTVGSSSIKTDGSAFFTDSVNVQGPGNALTRVNLIATTGEIFCATGRTDAFPMVRVQGGRGSADSSDNVILNANGSAEFKGNVVVSNDPLAVDAAGISLDKSGTVVVGNSAGTIFYGVDTSGGTSDITTTINADGSATFAGNITAAGGILNSPAQDVAVQEWYSSTGFRLGYMYQAGTAGGRLFLQASDGSQNITLDGVDGSASFAGHIGIGEDAVNDNNLRSTSDQVYNIVAKSARPGGSGTDQNFTGIDSSGSITSKITADGSATFAGNITAGNVSDIKFKENITDAHPQLDDVVTLGSSLKNWDWKEEAPLNEELRAKRFLGLIAQEAEEVCPSLTYEVGEGEDSYKAINHDILVMKLLGAVAELKAEIEELKKV